MKALEGQKVVVTAGGSGIGRGIAECCLAAGADVGDPASVEAFFGEVLADWKNVDLLVNNAGIAGPIKPVEDVTPEEWDQTIRIDLSGMFYCARQVIPGMKERRRGSIINISSCSARVGMTNRSPYITAKVGVHGLTLSLARELGPHGIRCNAILPGGTRGDRLEMLIQSEMEESGRSHQEVTDELVEFVSLRTLVDPEDMGNMVVFLASDAGRRVTGQLIGVDGNTEWER